MSLSTLHHHLSRLVVIIYFISSLSFAFVSSSSFASRYHHHYSLASSLHAVHLFRKHRCSVRLVMMMGMEISKYRASFCGSLLVWVRAGEDREGLLTRRMTPGTGSRFVYLILDAGINFVALFTYFS